MNPYPYPRNKSLTSSGAPAPAIQTGPAPAGQASNPAQDAYNALPLSTRAYMINPSNTAAMAYNNQQAAQSAADFGGATSAQQFDYALTRPIQAPSYQGMAPAAQAGAAATSPAGPSPAPAAPAPVMGNQAAPSYVPGSPGAPRGRYAGSSNPPGRVDPFGPVDTNQYFSPIGYGPASTAGASPIIGNQASPVALPSPSASAGRAPAPMFTPPVRPDLRLPTGQGVYGRAGVAPAGSNSVVNALMRRYRPRGW